jgi:hypothetical protein
VDTFFVLLLDSLYVSPVSFWKVLVSKASFHVSCGPANRRDWEKKNSNYIVFLIFCFIIFVFKMMICRSTWRKEVIINGLHRFKCYLHEHLDLIFIFDTLFKKIFKTVYFSKYYHCSSFRLFD